MDWNVATPEYDCCCNYYMSIEESTTDEDTVVMPLP